MNVQRRRVCQQLQAVGVFQPTDGDVRRTASLTKASCFSSRFQEKGNLEVLLFTIQSKLRANNQKSYVPHDGKLISDINKVAHPQAVSYAAFHLFSTAINQLSLSFIMKTWERLEKAEHERGVALRKELIRQEKLELLAQRFDHKTTMRQAWLNENQRLVSQVG